MRKKRKQTIREIIPLDEAVIILKELGEKAYLTYKEGIKIEEETKIIHREFPNFFEILSYLKDVHEQYREKTVNIKMGETLFRIALFTEQGNYLPHFYPDTVLSLYYNKGVTEMSDWFRLPEEVINLMYETR